MIPVDYNISQPPPGNREPDEYDGNSAFWPVMILIIGTVVSTGYQIVSMQQQLGSITQSIGQLDPKIKQAEYERAKLYKLASDVLQLSATDANAKQIVTDYRIEQKSRPEAPVAAPENSPPVAPAK